MAFLPSLKKQLNKANQFMSERIGGVEGTKLNEEFMEMERKTDLTAELVDELINKTREYLQPNPATRSRMILNAKVPQNSRLRNYTQPEGSLGETILRLAHKFGEDSPYVRSLMETGESFKQMSEIKYALEDDLRQDFIEPLTQLQNKELRDLMFHRKKLESRRLDFDCKKRRRANGACIQDDEIKMAEEKFEESFNAASQGMHNLLQNDVEQMSQLVAFVEALRDYYKSCGTILEGLADKLSVLRDESAERQHSRYIPRKLPELNLNKVDNNSEAKNSNSYGPAETNSKIENGVEKHTNTPPNTDKNRGCCVALYDFQAENVGELGFKEGQKLVIIDQVDDNWYEGTIDGVENGEVGIFPTNYVQVTQPLAKKDPITNGE